MEECIRYPTSHFPATWGKEKEWEAGCLIPSLEMQMQEDQKFMAIFRWISDLEVSLGYVTPQLEEPN